VKVKLSDDVEPAPVPSRYRPYAVTPTLSDDADHEIEMLVVVALVFVRFAGAVGGCVSAFEQGEVDVVPVASARFEAFPAAS
jgi:hypothetical protein